MTTPVHEQTMTQEEIRQAGLEALLERLGPIGMLRFFQEFEPGQGDYAQERHRWLDTLDMPMVLEWVQQRRAAEQEQSAL